jgi:hypothetical protein
VASFDITEGVVGSLGVESGTTTTYANTNFQYNFAIAGIPFLGAMRDEDPLERAFAQVRRQQLDTAQVAGEQSLSNWWLRSQFTFTGGANQKIYEPAQDEAVRTRYADSQGVDPWTEGEVTLLPAMDLDGEDPGTPLEDTPGCMVAGASYGGTDYIVFSDGSTTTRYNEALSTAVSGATGTYTWLWPMGSKILACYSGGIDLIDVGTAVASPLKTCTGTPKAWWVKQRIISAVGNVLYEDALQDKNPVMSRPPLYPSDALSSLYTHPDEDWVWTSVVETPDAILASGYMGSKGAIYKFVLDQSNGELPSLTSAVTVLEFPQGEIPTSMISYLGSYVAIGTNKGVRIATVGTSGQLQLGALTVETDSPVNFMTARDRFIFAGITAGLPDGSSGVVRIDLSNPDQQGRYPYAWDVACLDNGTVTGVSQVGSSGRIAIASSAVWIASGTRLVESGWIDTSQVLYGTLEKKQFYFAELKAEYPGGTITLSSNVDGSYTSLVGYSASNKNEITRLPTNAVTKMGLRFTLNRDATDEGLGPVVTGWQMKALPSIERQEIIKIPLLCYDNERDSAGNKSRSNAWTRYSALVNAVKSAATVTFQNLDTGELANCVIEDLSFRQSSPPSGFDGFGGIATITVRKV